MALRDVRDLMSDDGGELAFDVEDIDAVVKELRSRGVVFEEYDLPGLKTVGGIATVTWLANPTDRTRFLPFISAL